MNAFRNFLRLKMKCILVNPQVLEENSFCFEFTLLSTTIKFLSLKYSWNILAYLACKLLLECKVFLKWKKKILRVLIFLYKLQFSNLIFVYSAVQFIDIWCLRLIVYLFVHLLKYWIHQKVSIGNKLGDE